MVCVNGGGSGIVIIMMIIIITIVLTDRLVLCTGISFYIILHWQRFIKAMIRSKIIKRR